MEFRVLKRSTHYSVLFWGTLLMFGCTKEVKIDIPGYEQQLVVDGSIEVGSPPIVLLSKSNDIYAPTNLEAYLSNFISGATVTVSDGTTNVVLDEICTDQLPPGSEQFAEAIFGIPINELKNIHLCVYTTLKTSVWGKIGKTYHLNISHEGKTYTSSTTLFEPNPPDSIYFKPAGNFTEKGYAWVKLKDPANQYDAYKIEYKFYSDPLYTSVWNPYFDDTFFDGLTFDFSIEDRKSYDDPTVPTDERGYFNQGDTLVLKISKLDKKAFAFFEKKYNQLFSGGNPFSTPTNIPSNISGGALGIWVGYSPAYDTLICKP
jgi:hypothetical protein